MAKKKPHPKPEGEPPKKKKASGSPRPKARRKVPDWREVEAAMWRMLGHASPPDQADDSPRSRASELLHEAFGSDDDREVVALAKKALEAWPDCADAYVLLAEHARGPKEALEFYTRGVDAAARDLGETAFRDGVGHFWGLLPTRPYMRARYGLAQVLWVLGRRDEAVGHYRELLRLNPGDNQGVRYVLASCLIELGRDEELESLLASYPDDASAYWVYSAALLAFRRKGDTPSSRKLLTVARKCNPFVPDYLTGREMLPSHMPDSVGRGDRNEAVDYAAGCLNGWRSTPGAIDWLRKTSAPAKPKSKAVRTRAARGPTAASKTRLRRLELEPDVWQADARVLPVWITSGDRPHRPWVVVVASLTDGTILGQEVCEQPPSPDVLWDILAKVMQSPAVGEPRRPEAIEVGADDRWPALAPHLEDVGVRCETPERLDLIDELIRQLVEHVTGRPPVPGLLEMPGVKPTMVGRFFEAAADYYRRAPWQKVGGAETIKIACDKFESGPWHAVIIGQMGMTLGIALYDDLGALRRIRDGNASDEQNARETVALSVTYGEQTEIAVADLEAAEEHGWEVAAPDAYPCPVRKERGLVMRPPLAWELNLLEATLRAVPDFVSGHDRDDESPFVREVATGGGRLRLELSWVTEEPVG
jgi:tetratricopeptide (TPR) repeat protein